MGLGLGNGFSRGSRRAGSGSFAMGPSSVSIIGSLKISPCEGYMRAHGEPHTNMLEVTADVQVSCGY
eukprot:8192990-Pyramimonas_sp.AAC.1